ncbi:uncharacterized protein LOC131676181 [Topomyia yanbarensis]|uniref:uncharacterized protein LOC131676181 n=1 Tax=Topomyia yanbarensis TaxID=2498891 RepID=UPI00273C3FA4|nr:uncharacterized protein LOC131676181 [Topomyia yanbarensis]
MSHQIRLWWKKTIRAIQSLDDERHYFRTLECAYVLAGIETRAENPLLRILFRFYQIMIVLQYLLCADRIYIELVADNFSTDFFIRLAYIGELTTLLSIIGFTRLYLKELADFRTYLEIRLDSNRTKERDQSYRLIRNILLVMQPMFLVDQSIMYLLGLLELPVYQVPENLRGKGRLAGLLVTLVNETNSLFIATLLAAVITIVNSYMMSFCAELKNIATDLADIFDRADREIEETVSNDQRVKGNPSELEVFKELKFLVVLKRELCVFAARHSDLLAQLNTVKPFFKWIFFCLFYGQLVTVAAVLFYMKIQGITTETVLLVTYTSSVLFGCYWFCLLADDMNDANELIGDTLYDLDWPQRMRYRTEKQREYREIRASMLTVMINSRHNLGISCGGLFNMSSQAFTSLMNMIYQSVMFLMNMVP